MNVKVPRCAQVKEMERKVANKEVKEELDGFFEELIQECEIPSERMAVST